MDKSKLLEGLKKIKEAFLTVQKFMHEKLEDGTIIEHNEEDGELKVGSIISIITDAGRLPIPDGSYTIPVSGVSFDTVGGIVSAVTSISATPPAAPQADPKGKQETATAPAVAAMTEAKAKSIIESTIKESHFVTEDFLTEKLKEITLQKETFATQKLESDNVISELKTEVATQKETIKQMFSLLETLAGEPSGTPAEPKNKPFDAKNFRKEFKADLDKIASK